GHLSLIGISDFEQPIGFFKVTHHLGQVSRTPSQGAQLEVGDYAVLSLNNAVHLNRNHPGTLGYELLQVANHLVPGERFTDYQLSRSSKVVAILVGQEDLGLLLPPLFVLPLYPINFSLSRRHLGIEVADPNKRPGPGPANP